MSLSRRAMISGAAGRPNPNCCGACANAAVVTKAAATIASSFVMR
jgi:hypothetical protein